MKPTICLSKAFAILLLTQMSLTVNGSVFDGMYISLGGGLQQNTTKLSSQTIAEVDPGGAIVSINLDNKLQTYDNNILGEIATGYSKILKDHIFVAADASLTMHPKLVNKVNQDLLSTANGTPSTILNRANKLQGSNLDLTLALKMGWAVTNNTVIYGLIGPQLTSFKSSSKAYYSADFGGGPFSAEGKDSNSKFKVGTALGAGLAQHIKDNIVIGLKYTHTIYNNMPETSFTSPIDGGATGTLNMRNKERLKTDAVILNVTYYI
jgi:opacity protein-like surface antigen